MPVMNGYEATIIRRKNNKEIPIIAITANMMKEVIQKAMDVGLDSHIGKPINVEELYTVLLKYINI